MNADLNTPIREALARISPDAFIQYAAYLLYVQRPEALAPGIRQSLDHAVEVSLHEMGGAA